MTEAEYKSEFESTKDTPYLALTSDLWGVFNEDFEEIRTRYNGTALFYGLLGRQVTSIHGVDYVG